MSNRFWIDGVACTAGAFASETPAPLSSWGEGFFETARVERGQILGFELHRARMRASLERFYRSAWDERLFAAVWASAAREAMACAERTTDDLAPLDAPYAMARAKLRIVAAPTTAAADRLRYLTSWTPWVAPDDADYARGVSLAFSTLRHPRLGDRGKSNAYHWARLGAHEAREKGVDDVVYVAHGELLESTSSSLLVRFGEEWHTPPASAGILASTTIAQLEAIGVSVERRRISVSDLSDARAMMLVNALSLVRGVRSLGSRAFSEPDEHARPLRQLLLPSDRGRP